MQVHATNVTYCKININNTCVMNKLPGLCERSHFHLFARQVLQYLKCEKMYGMVGYSLYEILPACQCSEAM